MIRRLFSTIGNLAKQPIRMNISPIQVTNSAWEKIDYILEKRDNHLFYFTASSGGCNGFNYDLNLITLGDYLDMTERLQTFTLLENENKSKIYVEPVAEMLLFGTTIDYVKEDWNKGIFENKFIFIPDKNLVTSCGCGVSFTPKD